MFDLVLFGATGFTGRLVAEYLRNKAEPGVSWAIAGRSRDKLEALRRELSLDVPVLVGDVEDRASLTAIVEQTRVVCTTVGPYARYGAPLVAACAARGIDYCDLTGEPHFIRRMIDGHHDQAAKTGARIVHCCGFDSIPSDLGVHALQSYARRVHGEYCESIVLSLQGARGGASGGTLASMLEIAEAARRDPEVRAVLLDPYALNPPGERSGPDRDPRGLIWDTRVDAWTAPFFMGPINTRIVRRSNALAGHPYGRDFHYTELTRLPRGAVGVLAGTAMLAGLGAFLGAASFGPSRALLEAVLPASGEGPSEHVRKTGYFRFALHGEGRDRRGMAYRVRGTVLGRGDPGYGATATMVSEAALCLARDPRRTGGGVLTPAYAMGDALTRRLRMAGMAFETYTDARV